MKPSLHFISLAIACCSSLGHAGEEQAAPPPEATTAHVLGDLPDGTPPPPEPANPGFIIPKADILESTIHEQGGRKIIVREISPIELPAPPSPPSSEAVEISPAFKARIAALRAKHPKDEIIRLSATVYRSKESAPRTLATYWPNGDEKPVTLWSSADFSLLWGFASFVGTDGKTRSLMMTWSTLDIAGRNRFHEKLGRPYIAPKIPELPPGKATFVITSGDPTVEGLASIQAIHDLYNNEHDRLKTAYEGRERAQRLHEAELKANPPQPKDIVINYWLTDSKDQANRKGTTR